MSLSTEIVTAGIELAGTVDNLGARRRLHRLARP